MAGRVRSMSILPAVLALAACMAVIPIPAAPAGQAPAPAPASPDRPPQGEPGIAAALVNQHRAQFRCPALAWDARAAAAAQAHSADMARRDYFAHQSPDGRGPAERLSAQGVAWRAVAENIAQTPTGGRGAVRLWIDSPRHRANIENCRYTHHGLGVSGDRWTHVFFTP